jgi:hypothetical protein
MTFGGSDVFGQVAQAISGAIAGASAPAAKAPAASGGTS